MLLQDKALDLTLSVSVTTRARRSSEVDGVHYHFIDRRHVRAVEGGRRSARSGRSARQWLRHAATAGRRGARRWGATCCSTSTGRAPRQVREALGGDVVSVFILPPSMKELRARLERRAEDSAATIGQRLENAKREIERWRHYDYVVINDDLQGAYRQVVAIVDAERARGRARGGGGRRDSWRGCWRGEASVPAPVRPHPLLRRLADEFLQPGLDVGGGDADVGLADRRSRGLPPVRSCNPNRTPGLRITRAA